MAVGAVTVHAARVNGVTIGYRATGDPGGAPALLLHGGANSAATWDRLAARLVSAGHRVLAADLRGHGTSSWTSGYPLAGYREDIAGLLDALALDRVALVGHSLGAYVAAVLAQRQPGRFTRLVLEEPPVPPRDPAGVPGVSLPRFALPALLGLGLRRGYDRRALVSAIRQLRVPDPGWWDALAAITSRTLVVSGGPGSHIPPARLAALAEAIPHARLVTVRAGHRVHSRRPDDFQAVAVPFLAGA